jgi:hypothetical protein
VDSLKGDVLGGIGHAVLVNTSCICRAAGGML